MKDPEREHGFFLSVERELEEGGQLEPVEVEAIYYQGGKRIRRFESPFVTFQAGIARMIILSEFEPENERILVEHSFDKETIVIVPNAEFPPKVFEKVPRTAPDIAKTSIAPPLLGGFTFKKYELNVLTDPFRLLTTVEELRPPLFHLGSDRERKRLFARISD